MGEHDEGDRDLIGQQSEFFESYFRRGAELARQLVDENQRLRERLAQLERDLERRASADNPAAATDLEALVLDIERENAELAALFVTQYQLHSSLELSGVLRVIVEVLANFVGADRFAVLFPDAAEKLRPLTAHGVELDSVEPVPAGHGRIGAALSSGVAQLGGVGNAAEQPLACVPLCGGRGATGIIAVWSFVPHKEKLTELDRRLFDLLGRSGGLALEAACLATSARRGAAESPAPPFEAYSALLK